MDASNCLINPDRIRLLPLPDEPLVNQICILTLSKSSGPQTRLKLCILGWRELKCLMPDQFFSCIPKDIAGTIIQDNPPEIRREDGDANNRKLEIAAKAAFARSELVFGFEYLFEYWTNQRDSGEHEARENHTNALVQCIDKGKAAAQRIIEWQ
jgi:hypothetical protein